MEGSTSFFEEKMPEWLVAKDLDASAKVHMMSNSVLDLLLILPATAFGTYGMPVSIVFAGVMTNSWAFGVFVAVCSVLTVLLTTVLKKAFARSRPPLEAIGVRVFNLRGKLNNHAFPSGDSAQAAVMGAALLLSGRSVLWFILTPLTMFARVYFGAHYIGDTIFGLLCGALVTHLVYNIAVPF